MLIRCFPHVKQKTLIRGRVTYIIPRAIPTPAPIRSHLNRFRLVVTIRWVPRRDCVLDDPDPSSYHEYHDHRAPKVHEKSAELPSTGMSSVVDTSNSDCKCQ